eukprot:2080024-Prymnesium_polylepis.1
MLPRIVEMLRIVDQRPFVDGGEALAAMLVNVELHVLDAKAWLTILALQLLGTAPQLAEIPPS